MLFRGEAGRPSPATRTSRLYPHARGLCHQMTALRRAKGPSFTGGGVCAVWRVGKTSSRRAVIAALPACVGLCRRTGALRHAKGHACTRAERLDGAGRAAHTAWTPWLRPHAWGLCRRMDALRRAKGPAFMRAGRLDGTGRAARLSCPGEPSCRKFSSGLAAGGGCRNVVGNGTLGGASACAPGSGACRQ